MVSSPLLMFNGEKTLRETCLSQRENRERPPRIHRRRKIEPLRVGDAELTHALNLVRALEPFHRHVHAEDAGEVADRADDLVVPPVTIRGDEGAVDLERVERKLAQGTEGRI